MDVAVTLAAMLLSASAWPLISPQGPGTPPGTLVRGRGDRKRPCAHNSAAGSHQRAEGRGCGCTSWMGASASSTNTSVQLLELLANQ